MSLIEFFLPRTCAMCGKHLARTEQSVCTSCRYTLPLLHPHSFEYNHVTRLLLGQIPLQRGFAYIPYDTDTQSHEIVISLKYRQRADVGLAMGHLAASDLLPKHFFKGIDLLVPVPLAPARLRKRGYNQAETLAQGIHEVTGIPLATHLAERCRETQTQTHLSADERQQNVSQAFTATGAATLGAKHLLLIDDVITTGSTIAACAKAILERHPEVTFSVFTLGVAKH